MKLRQRPEDFIVEEITSLEILKIEDGKKDKVKYEHNDGKNNQKNDPKSNGKPDFKIYFLEKHDIETFKLLQLFSENNNIPRKEIAIAGLKDTHALTGQYLSSPSKYNIKSSHPNAKLTFVGYSKNAIKLGDLKGNRFIITTRDVDTNELKKMNERYRSISKYGIPNYFDSQRFGSVVLSEEDAKEKREGDNLFENNQFRDYPFRKDSFIIKEIIKGNYEQAVKIVLTTYLESESDMIKKDKIMMHENWNNLHLVVNKIRNNQYQNIVHEYLRTKSWIKAYNRVSPGLRELYVSAYQSYLWNECIKELLRVKVKRGKIFKVHYNIGELLFYEDLSEHELREIPEKFQTISERLNAEGYEKEIVLKILEREKLELKDFANIRKKTRNFFKTHERNAIVHPENFKIHNPERDEFNRGKYKIKIEFHLPKGSYATVVIKALFRE